MTMRTIRLALPVGIAALALAAFGCGDDKKKVEDAGPDADTDADTDTDIDTDTDTDIDADTDADTDSDSDTDTGSESDPFLAIDLDCSNPVPSTGSACSVIDFGCAAGQICGNGLWTMLALPVTLTSVYCSIECSAAPFEDPDTDSESDSDWESDTDSDTAVDGQCDYPDGCFCEGSASTCVPFDAAVTRFGCLALGQYKARFEVNIVPAGSALVASDDHFFPMADSWNCNSAGLAYGHGHQITSGEPTDTDDPWSNTTHVRIEVKQLTTWLNPNHHRLYIDIPIEHYAVGTPIVLDQDSAASGAVLYFLEAQGPLNPNNIVAAQVRAVGRFGTIVFDEVAEPCQGAGCDLARGTIDITFLMLRGDIDPAPFN